MSRRRVYESVVLWGEMGEMGRLFHYNTHLTVLHALTKGFF